MLITTERRKDNIWRGFLLEKQKKEEPLRKYSPEPESTQSTAESEKLRNMIESGLNMIFAKNINPEMMNGSTERIFE
jgi:hypothetical protein